MWRPLFDTIGYEKTSPFNKSPKGIGIVFQNAFLEKFYFVQLILIYLRLQRWEDITNEHSDCKNILLLLYISWESPWREGAFHFTIAQLQLISVA